MNWLQILKIVLILMLSAAIRLQFISMWLGFSLMIFVAFIVQSRETWLRIVSKWKFSPNKTERFGYERIEATITHFSTKTERSYDQDFTLVSLEYEFEYKARVYTSSNIDFIHHKNSLVNPARFQPKDAVRLFSGFEVGQKIFVNIFMGNLSSIGILEIANHRSLDSRKILVNSAETA